MPNAKVNTKTRPKGFHDIPGMLSTPRTGWAHNENMEVRLRPEIEAKLCNLVRDSGQPVEEIVEDALSAWFDELEGVRCTLDSRYDGMESGAVKPIDGEEALGGLAGNTEQRRGRL
jgi:hypothetical protein